MSTSPASVSTPRVFVVTGGGNGIGRACALAFAREGYRVALADLNASAASAVADEIRSSGGAAVAIATDVADAASCRRMAEMVAGEFGGIDVLMNCAVVKASARRNFWEIPEDEWDRLMTVNVKGVWHAICAALPAMRGRGGGSIINMSSATVNAGGRDFLHYVTSKAAIVGLTRSMARELGDDGIRVNCIMPGYIVTGPQRPGFSDDATLSASRMDVRIVKRNGETADVVGCALFLASEASAYMTGQSLNLDGGRTFL